MKKAFGWLMFSVGIISTLASCTKDTQQRQKQDVVVFSPMVTSEINHSYEQSQFLTDSISVTTTLSVETKQFESTFKNVTDSEPEVSSSNTIETSCSTNEEPIEEVSTVCVTEVASDGEQLVSDTISTSDVTTEQIWQTKKRKIPDDVLYNLEQRISNEKVNNPHMHMGIGIYNYPDFEPLYETNINEEISAGCTVKAAYALYVLKTCESKEIDISNYYLTYDPNKHFESQWDSGDLKYNTSCVDYTIESLITKLLGISDNAAYNVLLESFTLSDFQKFLNTIGGQNLYGCRYGIASVNQRKNEWRAILEYDGIYGDFLRNALSNTSYCYIAQGLEGDYRYMHKSGWSDGWSYTCAADCAVINNTIIIIITADYSEPEGKVDVLRRIASEIESII